jgi:hypothetical protein
MESDDVELLCYAMYRMQRFAKLRPLQACFNHCHLIVQHGQLMLSRLFTDRPVYFPHEHEHEFIELYQHTKEFLQKMGWEGKQALEAISPLFGTLLFILKATFDAMTVDRKNGGMMYCILVLALHGTLGKGISIEKVAECSGICAHRLELLSDFLYSIHRYQEKPPYGLEVSEWIELRRHIQLTQRGCIEKKASGRPLMGSEWQFLGTLFPLVVYYAWRDLPGKFNTVDMESLAKLEYSKELAYPIPVCLVFRSLNRCFLPFANSLYDLMIKGSLPASVLERAIVYVHAMRLHSQISFEEVSSEALYQMTIAALILAEESMNAYLQMSDWALYSGYSVEALATIVKSWSSAIHRMASVESIASSHASIKLSFEELIHRFGTVIELEKDPDCFKWHFENFESLMEDFTRTVSHACNVEQYPIKEQVLFQLDIIYRKLNRAKFSETCYMYSWKHSSQKASYGLKRLFDYASHYKNIEFILIHNDLNATREAKILVRRMGLKSLPNVVLIYQVPLFCQIFFEKFPSEHGFVVRYGNVIYHAPGFGHRFVHDIPPLNRIETSDYDHIQQMIEDFQYKFLIDVKKLIDKRRKKENKTKPPTLPTLVATEPAKHVDCNPLNLDDPIVGTHFVPIKFLSYDYMYLNPGFLRQVVGNPYWVVHFWNHSKHAFRRQFEYLHALALNRKYSVVAVQLDPGVEPEILAHEIQGLDLSRVGFINDYHGDFKGFFLSKMSYGTPACLIGFGNRVFQK